MPGHGIRHEYLAEILAVAAAAPAETAPDFQHEGSAGNSADDNFPLPPALDQDPLLSWDSSNQDSIHAFPGANAWLASASLSLQGTNQEWNTPAESDLVRRWSQRRSTLDSILNDDEEFNRHNPHWDDMITFRQTRVRVPRERAWSGSEASLQGSGDALLAHGNSSSSSSKGWRLLPMATNMAGRTLCLTVLPVVAVLLWCSVPLKTDTVVLDDGRDVERLNFWFFLFFYYGIYNAVALALVTQIFHIYSLTWWPRSMSGLSANIISWVFSIALGALIYMMDTGIEKEPLMWTGLTLLTLLLPVFISFVIIQKHHRRSRRRRHHASEDQPLMANTSEWRTPSSYRRFLWFCTSFMLWYAALTAGEYLAYIYIETLPHRTADGFFYVYSWIATVSILSGAANWVVGTKIRSWPLQNIYLLYFFMTYFIFYRNLFARLQNPEQVVFLQLGSSLWVVFIYPVRMAKWVYRVMAYFGRWGDDYPYEVYAKQLGRTFFLRNKAENATMLGFLFWVTILHFGPNSRHYPYFLFKSKDDEFDYSYSLTIRASIYVWVSEIISSRIVRCLFRWIYKQDIGSEAVYDFRRYPHVVPVMVLVTIHVLQNILFGLIHLDFS
ncbi:hypothetical protein GGI12_000666 [Dipsacomyces acuminosporus]|nr:hypothetical protein GGI12_000666 [Dipsacomyces acuminosporus]